MKGTKSSSGFIFICLSGFLKSLFFILFYTVWVFCLHVCLMPKESSREHRIPWSWNYRWFVSCGVRAGNRTRVLYKSRVVLTVELSLQSTRFVFGFRFDCPAGTESGPSPGWAATLPPKPHPQDLFVFETKSPPCVSRFGLNRWAPGIHTFQSSECHTP